ncbi:hypothetical protein ABT236_30540 [Streptomyces sp. NPDC001523]|uniref:hypothetical protein n=1 Tax=Streptomyces sp. NPDC001523 TaxID=3154383 RepID=UPI003328687B
MVITDAGAAVRVRGLRVAGLGVGCCLMVAGCGGVSSDGKPAGAVSSVVSSSAVPADPQAVEKAAVLTAYAALTAAEERSYATARVDPELTRYATDKALADIQARRRRAAGTR